MHIYQSQTLVFIKPGTSCVKSENAVGTVTTPTPQSKLTKVQFQYNYDCIRNFLSYFFLIRSVIDQQVQWSVLNAFGQHQHKVKASKANHDYKAYLNKSSYIFRENNP